MTYRVEPFALGDAEELAALHMRVWREAYVGMVSRQYLDGMELAPRIVHWRGRISLAEARERQCSPGAGVVRLSRLARDVATGRIVGFAEVGPARDDDAPVPQELSSLNVDAHAHGTGVARQLVEATLGDRAAYLWVVRQNARAIGFYGKLGFAVDGVTRRDEELDCDELRMTR